MCKCFLADRYNTKILMCFWEIDKLVIRGSKNMNFQNIQKVIYTYGMECYGNIISAAFITCFHV